MTRYPRPPIESVTWAMWVDKTPLLFGIARMLAEVHGRDTRLSDLTNRDAA
jgi:hypothetical protein